MYFSTYSVRSSFSLIPLMHEVRLRIRIAFSSQMWKCFNVLRNHGGVQGNKKQNQAKNPLSIREKQSEGTKHFYTV